MAPSKKSPRKRKPAKRKSKGSARKKTELIVTQNALVLPLDRAGRAAINRCLKKTGQVTMTLSEIDVSKLPDLDAIAAVTIND